MPITLTATQIRVLAALRASPRSMRTRSIAYDAGLSDGAVRKALVGLIDLTLVHSNDAFGHRAASYRALTPEQTAETLAASKRYALSREQAASLRADFRLPDDFRGPVDHRSDGLTVKLGGLTLEQARALLTLANEWGALEPYRYDDAVDDLDDDDGDDTVQP